MRARAHSLNEELSVTTTVAAMAHESNKACRQPNQLYGVLAMQLSELRAAIWLRQPGELEAHTVLYLPP